MPLLSRTPSEAARAWRGRVEDTRPRIATGFETLDGWLHRGGFGPGELIILGGRTGTRKTTVMLNMMASMLDAGVTVGLVGLDETLPKYAAKLSSVLSAESLDTLDDSVSPEVVEQVLKTRAAHLSFSQGRRPTFEDLRLWRENSETTLGAPMRVIFIDYISLLARDQFAGAEVQRMTRLIEELQVWTNELDVTVVALHQVGRFDEGSGGRYHGETPMSSAALKYGGEEIADVILGTYRPALDPVGSLESADEARAYFPDGWKDDKVVEAWRKARQRVEKYRHTTFLQLLKNRPGEQPPPDAFRGVELISPDRSMVVVEKGDALGDDMKYDPVSAAERVVARAGQ